MTATIHRFRRKPHAVVEGGPSRAAIGRMAYSVELVDDQGRHRDIWTGEHFADAIAEAAYLDCPIFLRLGTATEGRS
mgnify:CR=1 FL=1